MRVRGVEFDGTARINARLSVYGTAAYADGRNMAFANSPAPLEATGGPAVVDISGSALAGLSKWAFAAGGEYLHPVRLNFEIFAGLDSSYRSSFSSSATPSPYLVVDGYGLLNTRVGFRKGSGWSVSVWARNLLDTDYFEMLNPVGGNTGMYVGFLGDPRAFGVTVRTSFGSN